MDVEEIEGKVCTKCGIWKPLEEYYKKKGGRRSECKECKKEQIKQHYQNNKEHIKQYRENNKERMKEYNKQYRENNKEHIKQWKENNKEYHKEYNKQYRENNKEHIKELRKQWRESNPKYGKQWKENNKQNNLQYISSLLEQINPTFKQLKLPVYGYVYMFENIKTGRKYVGQSINSLKRRYGFEGGIVKSWIKERLEKLNQKFKEELIETDIKVTEVLDVAFCQYHLDKLEAYYIDKYDSYNNGYNNNAGHHNTDDGLNEFNEILKTYNLQYIDGKIIKAPTQR